MIGNGDGCAYSTYSTYITPMHLYASDSTSDNSNTEYSCKIKLLEIDGIYLLYGEREE